MKLNKNSKEKNISIGERVVITDWRDARVISPENLQSQTEANERAEYEIEKQEKVESKTSNFLLTGSF